MGRKPLINGLDQAIEISKDRGGKCLCTEYINNKSLLEFECNNGHQWKAALSDIKKGSWCPICNQGIKEKTCRFLFEEITNNKFPKKRPDWLLNDRGNQMELDGYCNKLKLAFEYNGEQHYIKNKHFQRREESLEQRQKDDNTKLKLCDENNIKLIIVPYTVSIKDLPTFIYNEIELLNLNIGLNINVNTKHIPSNELENLKNIAKSRGGKCLSNIYYGATEKHTFLCSKGHIWEATPANIKSKKETWCPTCKPERIGTSNRKYTLDDMVDLAALKNGKYISNDFKSVNYKYIWECEEGHQWEAAPMDVIKGRWCIKCSITNKKDNIYNMQNIANERGGKCLSIEYINSYTKLLWECEEGHQWEAKANNIKNKKSWCPYCTKKNKGEGRE